MILLHLPSRPCKDRRRRYDPHQEYDQEDGGRREIAGRAQRAKENDVKRKRERAPAYSEQKADSSKQNWMNICEQACAALFCLCRHGCPCALFERQPARWRSAT